MDKEDVECIYIYIYIDVYTHTYTHTHIHTHTMEYYAAIKRNETLPFVTMWMELEGIMLRELSQSEKDNYHMISLIRGS